MFQLVVEKMLAAEGTKRTDLGREEFVARVWEWKAKYGGTITNQLRRLGASCDWSRERFTLDEKLSGELARHFEWLFTMASLAGYFRPIGYRTASSKSHCACLRRQGTCSRIPAS